MKRIAYQSTELTPKGQWISWGGPVPIYTAPVSPKENFRMLLRGETPYWMPNNADFTTLIPRVVPDNVARGFVMDADPLTREEMGGKDMFGIDWAYVDVAGGSMVKPGHPLLEDISQWREKLHFPDIETWDWAGSAARNKAFVEEEERFKYIWFFTGLFERMISFLDFENAVVALIDEEQKEDVHGLLTALCDFYEKLIDKYVAYYHVDAIYFHDDWGAQRAPFFSLDTCMEMLMPYLKRVADYCHSKGLILEFHSCGKNEMLVPAMVAAGVDLWEGQDFIDKPGVFAQYGDKLMLAIESGMPMEGSDEAIAAAAKAFVEQYTPELGKKKMFCCDIFITDKQRENLYILSRQALDSAIGH